MLKTLQARLQQYVYWELPNVEAEFRKGRGKRDQIANICRITENCRKFFKRQEYQTTLAASWETCMQVKKQQLEQDMEQQTGSKSGKEYVKYIVTLLV